MSPKANRLGAWRRPALLAAIASVALATGTLVYLIDRPPGHALLIPHLASGPRTSLFGPMGAWLPSFVHPLAFALLTAAALSAACPWRYGGCAAWGAVNVAFELGQHSAFKAGWLELTRQGVVPEPLARYFIHGSFDGADLAAAVAGALAAAGLLCALDHWKENDRGK